MSTLKRTATRTTNDSGHTAITTVSRKLAASRLDEGGLGEIVPEDRRDLQKEHNVKDGAKQECSTLIERSKSIVIDVSKIDCFGPPCNLFPLVRERDRDHPCKCHHCLPMDGACEDRSFHLGISLIVAKKNKFGFRSIPPPTLIPLSHTSKNLVPACIAYFDRSKNHLNNDQLKAIKNIREFHNSWSRYLDHPDGSSFPEARALQLCQNFSHLFFFRALPNMSVTWKPMSWAYGQCHVSPRRNAVEIEANPELYAERAWPDHPHPRKMCRIGTFLHETLHCFVEMFACSRCRNDCDHGRTWQLIAMKVEECAPRLLGFEIRLQRFKALRSDIKWMDYVPSMCKMKEFGMA
ncbi:hypothetical protein K491DRAFT_322479 [Lophiostoma macrostomum CBS 122681]|uniref:SprT-like domain-containing protein n=1 Tax=Lophiostoma macrostomum CBS 122681 TaxID=1314788 RepID=A0A6A6SIL3_9PLEO|nr:hypothetical protein K491DRAFT_322479 [Lophiostoma macrostomum CBS 122681]